jgi:hypothetical protein
MPVPPTEDNPHGWGYVEKRIVEPYYQLSPRIQIVVGDEIKVSKGPYWVNKDGVKVSMDKMKGKWQVTGIFENFFGEIEMDIIHCWPGGLLGSTSTIRITGDEYPSPIVDVITRRPYKIRLAAPKHGKRAKRDVKKKTKVDLSALAEIIKKKTKES